MAFIRIIILSIQFLTILPTTQLREVSVREMRYSVAAFPFIGTFLGLLLYFTTLLFSKLFPHLVAVTIAFAIYTGVTGALHWDALMDTADAIGSRRARSEALSIMKDSRVGAIGVAVCILVVLMKWASLQSLNLDTLVPFILVPTLSRMAMVFAMFISPAAQPTSGLGSVYAKQIPTIVLVVSSGFTAIIAFSGLFVYIGGFILIIALLITIGYTFWLKHRFGGMTGDTYGALNEIVEVVIFAICSGFEMHGLM